MLFFDMTKFICKKIHFFSFCKQNSPFLPSFELNHLQIIDFFAVYGEPQ